MSANQRAISIARAVAASRSHRAGIVVHTPKSVPLIQSHGATEVTTFEREVHVVHMSRRAGVTEADVAANFDAIMGPGTFARVRPHAHYLTDGKGGLLDNPSDRYVLIVPLDAFKLAA